MKQRIVIFLFLCLFAACKAGRQTATQRREKIQTTQTVLDSLSGRMFSDISAKRKIRARLFAFAPPDSLGRQAIRAVLEMDVGEEESRKDSISVQTAASLEETTTGEAIALREMETNASLLSLRNIAAILIIVAAIAVGVRISRIKF